MWCGSSFPGLSDGPGPHTAAVPLQCALQGTLSGVRTVHENKNPKDTRLTVLCTPLKEINEVYSFSFPETLPSDDRGGGERHADEEEEVLVPVLAMLEVAEVVEDGGEGSGEGSRDGYGGGRNKNAPKHTLPPSFLSLVPPDTTRS